MTTNTVKTVLLLGLLSAVCLLTGEALGGVNGLYIGLAFAALMNFGSYFFSDKIALATSGAQPISRDENPRIYQIVERLAAKASNVWMDEKRLRSAMDR